jgi:hypothetical protein
MACENIFEFTPAKSPVVWFPHSACMRPFVFGRLPGFRADPHQLGRLLHGPQRFQSLPRVVGDPGDLRGIPRELFTENLQYGGGIHPGSFQGREQPVLPQYPAASPNLLLGRHQLGRQQVRQRRLHFSSDRADRRAGEKGHFDPLAVGHGGAVRFFKAKPTSFYRLRSSKRPKIKNCDNPMARNMEAIYAGMPRAIIKSSLKPGSIDNCK